MFSFDQSRPAGVRSGSLAIGLSLACLALSFVLLALSVQAGRTWLDSAVMALIQDESGTRRGGAFVQTFWEDVTVLGSGPIVTIVVVFCLGYLALARHGRTAAA